MSKLYDALEELNNPAVVLSRSYAPNGKAVYLIAFRGEEEGADVVLTTEAGLMDRLEEAFDQIQEIRGKQ